MLKQKWHNTNNHNNIRDKKFFTENYHHHQPRRCSSYLRKFKKQKLNSKSSLDEVTSSKMETSRFKQIIRYDYIKTMFGTDKSREISKKNQLDDDERSIRLGLLTRTLRACALGDRKSSITSHFSPNQNGQIVNGAIEPKMETKKSKPFFDYNSATVPTSRLTGFSSYSEHFNSIKDTLRNLKKKVFIYKGYLIKYNIEY